MDQQPTSEPLLVSKAEAARTLGVSVKTVYRMLRRGDLDGCTVGRRVLVDRNALLERVAAALAAG